MSSTSITLAPRARLRRPARRLTGLRHPALLAGAATLVLAAAALVAVHRQPRPPVAKPVALAHVLADRAAGQMLSRLAWTRSDVTVVDHKYELLGFYRGPKLLATVGVGFNGHVVVLDKTNLTHEKYAYGSNIANNVVVLAMLSVVFLLMTGVWPLWRVRNLDALVAASSALSIVLFNRWTLDRMVLVSYPGLIYLALRCAWRGLAGASPTRAATPLFERLTSGWTPVQQVRILRLAAIAAALILALVGLSSLHVIDVGYAVMEGATAITHGLLPYGHVPDVLHGDTYPIGSYLLYAPFAALSPVHNQWDDADFTLLVAVAAAMFAAWALRRLVLRAGGGAIDSIREMAGLRAAIAWMTFPPLLLTVSTGTTDPALAAMLVGALVLWRRPAAGAAVLSAAAWFKAIPVALFPLWLARLRGRDLVRALLACAGVTVAMLASLTALGGAGALPRMLRAMEFQLTRQSAHTLWTVVGSVPLQQLTQAATLALIVAATVRLRREPAIARDRNRFAALAGAIVLGVQISGNYWTFMYLVWAFPFLALSVLAPVGPEGPQGNESDESASQVAVVAVGASG